MARPEIHNQLVSGSPMSERELYVRTIEGLTMARDSLRGLAASRKDARWLFAVRLLDEIIDSVKKLIDRPGARMLWLPPNHH